MEEDMTAVLIVGIIFAFVSFRSYLGHRNKRLEFELEAAEGSHLEEIQQLQARVNKQEKRIQVLESIVTSKDFKLTEEIDSLA